jgi:hypothetical protein
MTAVGLGRVKTKSDLVAMPSGRQIFAFLLSRMTIGPKIPGAVLYSSHLTFAARIGTPRSCHNRL